MAGGYNILVVYRCHTGRSIYSNWPSISTDLNTPGFILKYIVYRTDNNKFLIMVKSTLTKGKINKFWKCIYDLNPDIEHLIQILENITKDK